MRILFVHGTGVRRERHDALFGNVHDFLLKRLPQAKVSPCYWGDTYGATLGAGGRSVPGLVGTRSVLDDEYLAASPQDREAAAWMLLLADPLCELRVLAEMGGRDKNSFGVPGVRAAGEAVAEQLQELPQLPPPTDELSALLSTTGLDRHFARALTAVGQSEEFMQACRGAEDEETARETATATARAVVAWMLAADGAEALCTGDERDRLVDLVTGRLGGTARFPGGRVAGMLGRLAMRVTTQPALNHWRGSITQKTTPALGDILRYQARGGPLRDYLMNQISAEPGPSVVIGHSLGGIALVDMLALAADQGKPVSAVELLVTVGSQAPFLHELGALAGLVPGTDLPDKFPTWLNIFDRQDILSYLAEPVFPHDSRVTDHEVSSRQPFPSCHSAYWKLDTVYDRIAEAVKAIG